MCGIFGIVNKEGIDTESFSKALDTLKHRGPDDEGYALISPSQEPKYYRGNDSVRELAGLPHISEAKNFHYQIALGHRRLSIIDLSEKGHQPLANSDNNKVLVFNGEIYNYKEIRTELANKGYKFHSQSDSEVLLAAYDKWGIEALERLRGMWGFAIWDKSKRQIVLARDRFSIKPLYYALQNNAFIFSSEAKTLLNYVDRKIDANSLYEYLSFNFIRNPTKTLFEDIYELPGGHYATFDLQNHKLSIGSYYDVKEKIESNKGTVQTTIDSFSEEFTETIALHLRSDVTVGSCLSGGLDSSSIVALTVEQSPNQKLQTFTARYNDPSIDEGNFAQQVAQRFTTIEDHYVYPSSEMFWGELEKLIWHHDFPIHSSSIFAQWCVMDAASKQKTKVLMDGQGADECLGGYQVFAGIHLLSLVKSLKLGALIKELRNIRENRGVNPIVELMRASLPMFPHKVQASLRKTQRVGHRFLSQDAHAQYGNNSPATLLETNFLDTSLSYLGYPLRELLRYEDRNSMAFSIESRVPFLDHKLVESMLLFDSREKFQDGWSKYPLRKLMESKLPHDVVWRKDKKGFLTPQFTWLNELKKQVQSYLEQFKYSDFFSSSNIKYMLSSEVNKSEISEVWKIVSVLKWMEVFKLKL